MAPTLLALCGLKVPEQMQGTDLSRVALGETTLGPDVVLMQIFVPFHSDGISKPWRGIRTARYTYARYEDAPWVLFDNEVDPWQMDNLAGNAAHAELERTLDGQLAALMKKHGDAWSFNSLALVEEKGRLYRSRTFFTVQEYLDWAKEHPEAEPK